MHIKKFAVLALALAAVTPGNVRADDDPKGYACTFATGTATGVVRSVKVPSPI